MPSGSLGYVLMQNPEFQMTVTLIPFTGILRVGRLATMATSAARNSYMYISSFYIRNYTKISAFRSGFGSGFFPTPPSSPFAPVGYWFGGGIGGYLTAKYVIKF